MKIYNTLSKRKEEFIPLEEGRVKMYVCGPTVYNLIHIGNARPMIVFDTARRYMEYKGYKVNFVSNFTDVDDKIIAKANEEGVTADEISKRYIEECKKDMEGMNVRPATTHPLATEEIEGMVEMIQTLIDKGFAYPVADGTVYFRVKKFKEYGKLSHKNLDDLQSGFRALQVSGEEQKEDPLDFVLWKPRKEGEPAWPSPWCEGRPGWHIECSVMSKKYLGEEIDIHAGGEDLIFPHHENEIAQSECCNGKVFARYWMHNGFLNIDNKKMSKSLGNFFTVREIAEQYDLQVLRFFMLNAHYRSPLNFSRDLMEASKNSLERILNGAERLRFLADGAKKIEISPQEQESLNEAKKIYVSKFEEAKMCIRDRLGLVPCGEIVGQTENSPTLTFNTIGRHISKMVYTKVVSNKSPWLAQAELGKVYCSPASHGEGRFVASDEWLQKLFANGQVATQYVTPEGELRVNDEEWNVNGSYCAIEGITSPDGRVLGKMAHSERRDRGVAMNIYGEQDIRIFESGVQYFK